MTNDEKRVNAELQRKATLKEAMQRQEMNSKLAKRFRHYRGGMSREALAIEAGSSITTIQRIEAGKEKALSVTVIHLLRLCKALNVDLSTMMRGIHL